MRAMRNEKESIKFQTEVGDMENELHIIHHRISPPQCNFMKFKFNCEKKKWQFSQPTNVEFCRIFSIFLNIWLTLYWDICLLCKPDAQ
jgi:hypothetical protein